VRWIPPTLGGKSFVTMSVLGISTGWISSQRVSKEGAVTDSADLEALESERAFSVLVGWRVIAVRGTDARAWLQDLVTADVEGVPDRRSLRSLLLTPTGRIRADFHVAAVDVAFLLLQGPEQPEGVDAILRPYVLSSDVQIEDRTDRSTLVAVLGDVGVADGSDPVVLTPSVAGPGSDVVVATDGVAGLVERLRASGLVEVDPAALETWRIRRGIPRMGVDFGPDALPSEVGLEGAIDFTKGCFLGQESVAKVRNLGHPRRVLLHVRSEAPVARGASVLVGKEAVGEVTSAAAALHGVDAIVRVRWDAARERLGTEVGPLVLQNQE
jgi:tRNA-modifying protein YgfZ